MGKAESTQIIFSIKTFKKNIFYYKQIAYSKQDVNIMKAK